MKTNKLIKFAASLMLCCMFFGCTPEEEKLGTIYGTVTDFSSGEPIGNANVRLNPRGETTLTGMDGTFEFVDLPSSSYSLSLSKNGYVDLDDDYVIEIENGNSVRRDLQLNPNVFCTISGTVIDLYTGDPIQQVLVTLSPIGKNVFTVEDGRFEFVDLDARQYTVTAQKTGYITNRKTVMPEAGSVVDINLAMRKND